MGPPNHPVIDHFGRLTCDLIPPMALCHLRHGFFLWKIPCEKSMGF